MKMTVSLNSEKIERQLELALRRNPQKTVEKVKAIAIDLAGKSAARAPIESGDLRNNCSADLNGATIYQNQAASGNVMPATQAIASIGYSLPYALRQHEDLALRHDRTDGYTIKTGERAGLTVNKIAGGEAKYLENPFNENAEHYANQLRSIPGEVIDEATGTRRSSKLPKGQK